MFNRTAVLLALLFTYSTVSHPCLNVDNNGSGIFDADMQDPVLVEKNFVGKINYFLTFNFFDNDKKEPPQTAPPDQKNISDSYTDVDNFENFDDDYQVSFEPEWY